MPSDSNQGNSQELRPLKTESNLGTQITPEESFIIHKSCIQRMKSVVRENSLVLLILLGVVLGVCLGFGLRELNLSEDALMWLGLPGEIFLRSLKATIVPLVICMVISCTSTLDPKSNGKIAVVGMLGFLGTQIIASMIAVCLFYIFRPGSDPVTEASDKDFSTDLQSQDVFADLIRNIFPDNIVSATFSQTTTVYETKNETVTVRNESFPNITRNYTVTTRHRGIDSTGGTNILGLILVCAVVGIASNKVLRADSQFLTFFRQAEQVTLVVIRWLFWTTPVGVLSLIAVSIAAVEDIGDVFYRLAMLVASVCIGLVFYTAVVIPILLFLIRRVNPFVFLSRCVRPFIIGFASTATSVAIPEMLVSCERNDVDPSVSAFVIPMSVTLHADGSALYITAASLFVAQASGLALGLENIFIIGVMSGILSLAIPPVPSASIVTVVIILTSLSYPLQDVALLFAVEWLLDRLRSGVIASSHVVVAAMTDSICKRAWGLKTLTTPSADVLNNLNTELVVEEGKKGDDEEAFHHKTSL